MSNNNSSQDQQQPWVQDVLASTAKLQTIAEHLNGLTTHISSLKTGDSDEAIDALLGVCTDFEAYKKQTMDNLMEDTLKCARNTSKAIRCPILNDHSERCVRLSSWLVQRVSHRLRFAVEEIGQDIIVLRKRAKNAQTKNSSGGSAEINPVKILRGDLSRPDKRWYFRHYWMLRLVEKNFVDDPDSLDGRSPTATGPKVKEEDRALIEFYAILRVITCHLGNLREYLRSMTTNLMERCYPEVVFYNLEHQRPSLG